LLSAIGVVFALRLGPASASLVHKQLIWLGLGIALMIGTVVGLQRYAALRDYKYLAAVSGIGLMAVTAVVRNDLNGSRLWLGAGLLVVVASLFLAYHLFGYVRVRIDLWLHPLTHVHDTGYQIAQSVYAFAGGGVLGTGLGRGYPGYVPVVPTDFIFAAIGEE